MTAPTGKAAHRNPILSIDRGSSSLKVAVFDVGPKDERLLLEGEIEAVGTPDGSLQIRDHRRIPPRVTSRSLADATPVAAALACVRNLGMSIEAVGHRFVYGGLEHEAPARVTDRLMTSLEALVKFDPLHLPDALAAVRDVAAELPDVPQVVCFDTAFHHRMPAVAQRLPLPLVLWSEGLRRYGFHGLSYESIVRASGPTGVRGRMIVAHLGSGASAAAIRDGKPVDTTMGFSADGSRVVVRMLPAQENRMIVRHTFATLFATPDDDRGAAFTPALRDAARVVTTPV